MAKVDKLTSIRPQARNANKHTQRGLGLLEDSIQKDGWISAITVAADGEVFDGSARIEVGVATGFSDAIVVESDGTRPVIVKRVDIASADDPKAKRLGIAANRVAQVDLAWDVDTLKELVEGGIELSDFWTDEEFTALLDDTSDAIDGLSEGADPDAIPENVPTRCKGGQLWELGKHRLLCGDGTSVSDVARLMGGEKADMVFTDPPYGVDYKGILNDSRSTLKQLLYDALKNACDSSQKGAAVYMFHSDKCADIFNEVFRAFCHFSSMIIWVKPSLVMGQSDYHSRHEPCLYGWFSNGTHNWYGDRKGDTVWECGRDDIDGHTTPKPVEFISRAIANSSKAGQIILDLFGGSGSTLIAAEKTGRRANLMEVDPTYCDVIIQRWENATGGQAELLS